jgi:hypothetical protein
MLSLVGSIVNVLRTKLRKIVCRLLNIGLCCLPWVHRRSDFMYFNACHSHWHDALYLLMTAKTTRISMFLCHDQKYSHVIEILISCLVGEGFQV